MIAMKILSTLKYENNFYLKIISIYIFCNHNGNRRWGYIHTRRRRRTFTTTSICMYKFLLTRINKLIIECLTGIFLKCYITFLAFIQSSSNNISFDQTHYEMFVFKFQRGTIADESSRYHCTVKPHTFISLMVLT